MSKSPNSAKYVSTAEYQRFVNDILRTAGAAASDTKMVCEALLWSDLRAQHAQGINRLPMLVRRLQSRLILSPAAMAWSRLAPAVYHLNAGNGFGQIAGRFAMAKAVEIAASEGIGMAAVNHSNLYGAAGYFCNIAADAGCIGMTCTNAFAKVAPYGGTRPVFGTNPLAFGCPQSSGVPIIVDLSSSTLAGSSVRGMTATRSQLPTGTALDHNGKPTTDPEAASKGCLLPVAGPKGYGLALMVEIFCGILTGAAMGHEVGSMYNTWDRPVNTGHLFIAITIDRFQPKSAFLNRLDTLLGWIKATPMQENVDEILIPGEIRARYAEEYSRSGIPLPQQTSQDLEELARGLHVQIPW